MTSNWPWSTLIEQVMFHDVNPRQSQAVVVNGHILFRCMDSVDCSDTHLSFWSNQARYKSCAMTGQSLRPCPSLSVCPPVRPCVCLCICTSVHLSYWHRPAIWEQPGQIKNHWSLCVAPCIVYRSACLRTCTTTHLSYWHRPAQQEQTRPNTVAVCLYLSVCLSVCLCKFNE